MKKILVSMMTIAMVSALIGGGIYAAFSDTETSDTNQFTAGSLDLTVNGSNGTAFTAVTASAMEPGDSGNQAYTLVNAASTTELWATVEFSKDPFDCALAATNYV